MVKRWCKITGVCFLTLILILTLLVSMASAAEINVIGSYDSGTCILSVSVQNLNGYYNYFGLRINDAVGNLVATWIDSNGSAYTHYPYAYGSGLSGIKFTWPNPPIDVSKIDEYWLELYSPQKTVTDGLAWGKISLVAPSTSGTFCDTLSWKFDNGTLTISGKGKMDLPTDEETLVRRPWEAFVHQIKSVVIETGVKSVGNGAFTNCDELSHVQIADSVTSIGIWAFAGTKLSSIAIPDSVTSIDSMAFNGCKNLQSIKIPDGVTKIKKSTFAFCDELTEVTLPNDLIAIDQTAFANCVKLSEVTFPKGISNIGKWAFWNCAKLSEITFPEKLKDIDAWAFSGCSGLKTVRFSSSLQSIGQGAFYMDSGDGVTAVPIASITDVYYDGSSAQWAEISGLPAFHSSVKMHYGIFNGKVTDFHFDENPPQDVFSDINHYDRQIAMGGNNIAILGGELRYDINVPDDDLQEQLDKIVWSFGFTNNSKVVELDESSSLMYYYDFNGCYWYLPIKVIKPGLATIVVTAPGGIKTDSIELLVESTLVVNNNAENCVLSKPSDVVMCHTTIDEPDEYFLQKFMAQVNVDIDEGTDLLRLANRRVVISADKKSAALIYRVIPVANGTASYTVTSVGGQHVKGKISLDYVSDIVKAVDGYATIPLAENWDEIINKYSDSDDEREAKLSELFLQNGLTDALNGTQYLCETTDKRWAYRYLTNNEAYCAHLYAKWLQENPKAHAAFLVAKYIYSDEIKSWISLSTAADVFDALEFADYPSVKKYKAMLCDFMDETAGKIEVLSVFQDVLSVISDIVDIGSDVADIGSEIAGINSNEAEKIIHFISTDLMECKTVHDVNAALDKLDANFEAVWKIGKSKDGNLSMIYTLSDDSGLGKTAKRWETASNTFEALSVACATANSFRDLIDLNRKLTVYEEYLDFLNDLKNASDTIPLELRIAAAQIAKELENEYEAVIQNILMPFLDDAGVDTIAFDLIEDALLKASNATMASVIAGFDIGVFCSNLIFGLNELVEKITYVQAYDFISQFYSQKLSEATEAFLANKTDQTACNFYYYYTMLYQLRVKGEEAYLEMSEAQGTIDQFFTDYGYTEKEAVVKETLAYLQEKCAFNTNVPTILKDNAHYRQKSVIRCPVNVTVSNNNGECIASLQDGILSDVTNAYGRFAVVYNAYSEDYIKVVCLNDDSNYEINLTGVDNGLVNYAAATAGNASAIYQFSNQPIAKSGQIVVATEEVTANGSYKVDQSGVGNFETKQFEVVSLDDDFILGDFNDDGAVTIIDVSDMIYMIVNDIEPTKKQLLAGDINDDHKITVSDVSSVIYIVVNQ